MDVNEIVKPVLMEGLNRIADWYRSNSNYYLRSIFDIAGFKDRHPDDPTYLVPPVRLSSAIPYPAYGSLQIFERKKGKR